MSKMQTEEINETLLSRKQQLCQKCDHRQSHFDFPNTDIQRKFLLGFLYQREQLTSQVVFLVKSKHWVLAEICFCVCLFFFLAGFMFKSSFFSKSRLCTRPLFSHFVRNLDRLSGQPILEFLRGVNPVGDDCMDLQPYSHVCFSKISRTFFASRN